MIMRTAWQVRTVCQTLSEVTVTVRTVRYVNADAGVRTWKI